MRPDRHRQRRETKGFSKKRASTLVDDLELLLGDLCVRWGFCNRLDGVDLLRGDGVVTAGEFAERVLLAEKMDPALEIDWHRAMKRVFVERYGRDEVSVESYAFEKMPRPS